LLEQPGKVIGREELRRRLWQDGTFVDFESGLNTAANRLRLKLGDSAVTPRYIETLPRIGYRFIGPVEVLEPPQHDSAVKTVDAPEVRARSKHRRAFWAAAIGILITAGMGSYVASQRIPDHQVRFRELTFRRGQVMDARFMPDGQSVLYTARWENSPRQLFIVAGGGPESRLLGFAGLSLVSVSQKAELALLSSGGTMNIAGGMLYRVPVTGSAPAFAGSGVMSADWTRDSQSLIVVRAIDGKNQLESPSGVVVYRTGGWLSHVRQSRDSNRVAFIEHPFRHDESGRIMLFEPGKGVRVLSEGWASAMGVAWRPGGKEVWFTAAREHQPRSVWAATMDGRVRAVAQDSRPGSQSYR
jgi:hypothetical protein